MIDWFRSWSKGIIVAVIISTIIELILPDNTSKKYIKIILGIFIVYTIISPVIEEFTGKDINNYIEIDDSIETSSTSIDSLEISNNMNDSIKNIYKQNLENDLKIKLKDQGYIAGELNIKISDDDSYNISSIEVKIIEKTEQKKNQKEAQGIVQTIKEIKVKLETNSETSDEIINQIDKDKIKEYIKKTYEIDINNVFVS